jgi:hypothetical protein
LLMEEFYLCGKVERNRHKRCVVRRSLGVAVCLPIRMCGRR